MSQAKPTDYVRRLGVYLRQNGALASGTPAVLDARVTPRQRRRLNHKLREKMRETSRHGRLRRRYDAKDTKQVKAEARRAYDLTRFLLDEARGRR